MAIHDVCQMNGPEPRGSRRKKENYYYLSEANHMPSLHIMHLILKRTVWNEYYNLLFKVGVSEITKLRLTKSPKVM